jgi:hypothetical protein
VLRFIAGKRLSKGRLAVIDATNVRPESRKPLVHLAKEYHCLPVAIVLNPPERFVSNATEAGTIARLVRMSSTSNGRNFDVRSRLSNERDFGTSL